MNKNIIFDMDGVIFDTERLYIDCWEELDKVYTIPGIRDVALQCVGTNDRMTREIVMNHYGLDFPYDDYRKLVSERFEAHSRQDGMPVKLGVYELMEYLKKNGYRIGLASSTAEKKVLEELDMAKLTQYFDVIVCGDMVTKSKPDPQIFLVCAEQLGVTPEDTFVIEDSYNGIRAANSAGMKPIMVPDLLAPTEEIKALCYNEFTNLIEVRDWLQKA